MFGRIRNPDAMPLGASGSKNNTWTCVGVASGPMPMEGADHRIAITALTNDRLVRWAPQAESVRLEIAVILPHTSLCTVTERTLTWRPYRVYAVRCKQYPQGGIRLIAVAPSLGTHRNVV